MYPSGYFSNSFFPGRFFERAPLGPGGGFFGGPFWAPAFFCPAYWPRPWASDLAIGQVLVAQDGSDLHISFNAANPPGTVFQIYENRQLLWHGTATTATIPIPSAMASIAVVIVPDRLAATSFGPYLPGSGGGGDRALLSWNGGTFLAPDISSFKIFGSAAGGPVSFAAPLATVPAYAGGVPLDGWGLGGWGQGGWGQAASSYTWTSGRLPKGTYSYSVSAVDGAGNSSAVGSTVTVSIASAPLPPAPNSSGNRLTYTYNASTRIASLHWLASPG